MEALSWEMRATMSKITDKLIFELIKQRYRPFDTHEEFRHGFSASQE